MRSILILLVLAASHAAMVNADLKGEQDTGGIYLPTMRATLIADCGNSTIIAFLSDNESGKAVSGATMFVFRTDSGYRILNRSQTDAEGRGDLRIPGKMAYLNDLYVLRLEKNGYRSKEVQFTFWNCEEVQREHSEYQQQERNAANETPPAGISPEEHNESDSAILENRFIEPQTTPLSDSVPIPASNPRQEPPGACLGIIPLLLAFLR